MNKGCSFLLLSAIALVCWGGHYIYYILNHGELANKPIYAAMQGVELTYRDKNKNKSRELIYLKKYIYGKYDLLGIRIKSNQFPYFWIITNVHISDDSIPEGIYMLSSSDNLILKCTDLYEIERNEGFDKVVEYYLNSKCTR